MDDAARAAYQFFWNDFCDWYVEMCKPRLQPGVADSETARNVLAFVLETTLRLPHPVVPFISEEIWQQLPHTGNTICTAPYPMADPEWHDADAEDAMQVVIEATRALRNLRAELGIAPAPWLLAAAVPASTATTKALSASAPIIASLARLSELSIRQNAPDPETGRWIGSPITGAQVFLELGDSLDVGRELGRIEKELASVAREIERASAKLANPSFVERADPDIVAKERAILADWQEKHAKLVERRSLFVGK